MKSFLGIFPLLAALAVPAPGFAGSRVLEPRTGVSLAPHQGWSAAVDPARTALVLEGPGGLKGRLQLVPAGTATPAAEVARAFESDRSRLAERKVELEAGPAPELRGRLGGVAAWAWCLKGRTRAGAPLQLVSWLARSPAGRGQAPLSARLFVHGSPEAVRVARPGLKALLESLEWPPVPELTADPPPAELASRPGAGTEAGFLSGPVAAPALAAAALMPAGPAPAPDGAAPRRPGPDNRAFDRGSLSGGIGFMAEGGVIEDAGTARQLAAAFAVESRAGKRSEAEQLRAAAYMGFGSAPEADAAAPGSR